MTAVLLVLVLPGCLYDRLRYEELSRYMEDRDADGFMLMDDCDDEDSTVHPEALEICDKLDQDCNNTVDDNAQDAILQYSIRTEMGLVSMIRELLPAL